MLRNFRQVFKSSKTPLAGVMLILVVSFVIYLAPSGTNLGSPDTVVARIYGREVQYRELSEAIGKMLKRMPRQQNMDAMMPYLQGQALNQIMSEKLTQELAERHGIVVTDEEVGARLEAELRQVPAFLNADQQLKPVDEINDILRENGQTISTIEREMRVYMAALKLEAEVASQVPVDEAWVNLENRVRNEKITFESVTLAPDPSQVQDPGDAKLAEFLKASGTRFQVGPRRVVQYVALDQAHFGDTLKPSEQALKNAYEAKKATFTEYRSSHILWKIASEEQVAPAFRQAQELRAKLVAGQDFATTAVEVSQDPSAKGEKGNKGDMGWAKAGTLPKAYDDAALALKPGEISQPVRSNLGVHLIRLEELREKSFDEVRNPLTAQLVQEQFAAKAKEKLEGIRKRIGERGDLGSAAKKQGLKVLTSEPFLDEASAQIKDLPDSFRIPSEAFRMKVGQVSKVQKLGARFVLFRVTEERPSAVPPLPEVREKVLAGWKSEEARRKVLETAKAALAGGGFAALTGAREVKEAATLQSLGELGQHPPIRKALLDTPQDQTTPFAWTLDGKLWIAKVGARVAPEALTFQSRLALIKDIQSSHAKKLVQAEMMNLYSDGKLHQGFSSLWGRLGGIWTNDEVLKQLANRDSGEE